MSRLGAILVVLALIAFKVEPRRISIMASNETSKPARHEEPSPVIGPKWLKGSEAVSVVGPPSRGFEVLDGEPAILDDRSEVYLHGNWMKGPRQLPPYSGAIVDRPLPASEVLVEDTWGSTTCTLNTAGTVNICSSSIIPTY